MILNLDRVFKPVQGVEIGFESFQFTGGEPHIKILTDLNEVDEVVITHRVRTFNDMGLLLVACNALKNARVKTLNLVMPYFPGARQDRLMVEGEPLTVKVYADLINSVGFDNVTIFDAHSEVTSALLNNCYSINNFEFINQVVLNLPKDLVLISPDGGALKKIYKVAAFFKDYEVVECSKSRDVATGKLSGFKVYNDNLSGRPCLIVDDICDGGGTFLGLAKELKAKNSGDLYLAVSHGIFSKGLDAILSEFKEVFTTDSFCDLEEEKLNVIPLKEIL